MSQLSYNRDNSNSLEPKPPESNSGAQVTENQPNQKRQAPPSSSKSKSGPPNKRFKGKSGSRHGGVAYEKSQSGSHLQTSPVRPYFTVPTSTLGADSFTSRIYSWCVGRDYRYGTNVTLVAMQYATVIAMIARMALIAEKFGTRIDDSVSRLKSVSKSIILPSPICKMIECLGVVARAGFPTVVPYFPDWLTYEDHPEWYLSPATLLEQAGREVPFTPWAIDTEYLADYINYSARGVSRNLGFRTVNYEVMDGRPEMLYGYIIPRFAEPGELQPGGPSAISDSEAQLGAAYCWRRHGDEEWEIHASGNHLVRPDFVGTRFDVPTLVARLASEQESKRE